MGSEKTAVYRESMSQGHEFARMEKWTEAVRAYRGAVGADPRDLLARTCLAQALYKSGNLREAVSEYDGVLKLSPSDLLVLLRAAEIRRSLGESISATELYLRAAEIHLKERRREKALETWGAIVEAAGSDLGSLERLAKACAKAGEKQLEADVLLGIAHFHAEVADLKQAIKACHKAIDLDRSNGTAQHMLASLENGTNEWRSLDYFQLFKSKKQNARPQVNEAGRGVRIINDTASEPSSSPPIGNVPPAHTHRGPDALFSEAQQFMRAGDTLSAAATLCSAVAPLESDSKIAEAAVQQLTSLLPGWHKLSCSELAILSFEDRRATLQGMLNVEEYVGKKLNTAAVDACLAVIERAPGYLPAHVRLADIYVADGNVESARENYSRIVQLYEMRDDMPHAQEASARLIGLYGENDLDGAQLVERLMKLGNPDLAIEQGLNAADRLAARGDAPGCLSALRQIEKLVPNRTDVTLRVGELAEGLGLFAEAKEAYLRAWRANRADDNQLLRLVLLSARSDTWLVAEDYLSQFFQLLIDGSDFAVVVFKRVLDLGTSGAEKVELKVCLAASLRAQGKAEHARRMLSEIVGGRGFVEALARCLLASCLIDRGDFAGAIENLKSGLGELGAEPEETSQVSSTHSTSWLRLRYHWLMAYAYRQLGDEANMLVMLEALRKAAPDDRNLAKEIIGLYFSANKDELALDELNRLSNPPFPSGEREQLLQFYRTLIKRFPNKVVLRKRCSGAYVSLGLIDEAAQQLEVAVRLELAGGQRAEAIADMRHLVKLSGELSPEKSLAAMEKLVQLMPEDLSLRLDLVDKYLRAGLPSKSLQAAESLARELLGPAAPGQVPTQASTNTSKLAVDMLQRILALDPRNAWALEQLGKLLASLNRHEESIAIFRRLLRLDAQNSVARQYLAELER